MAGLFCIGFALWSAHSTYIPYATLAFNIERVWSGQIALLGVGLGLLVAADSKHLP